MAVASTSSTRAVRKRIGDAPTGNTDTEISRAIE
jgi:hypothetical protein